MAPRRQGRAAATFGQSSGWPQTDVAGILLHQHNGGDVIWLAPTPLQASHERSQTAPKNGMAQRACSRLRNHIHCMLLYSVSLTQAHISGALSRHNDIASAIQGSAPVLLLAY